MNEKMGAFARWYENRILNHPVWSIVLLTLVVGVLGYQASNFRIDASTETLLLENDPDLRYARDVSNRYGGQDFLVIAFSPNSGELLDEGNLTTIDALRQSLITLDPVDSVLTILDVPLLESPPVSFTDLAKGNIPSLESADIDKKLAKVELSESYFYRDLLVSRDMQTTAIIANLKSDPTSIELTRKRNEFLDKKAEGQLSSEDKAEYERIVTQIRDRQIVLNRKQHENILAVRAIMDEHRQAGRLYLGGVSMIADDMITYIKNDLKVFGLGVFILLALMLWLFFKSVRWIVLPMLCCFLSAISMMGILGTFGWNVTVISSNFISLQLIITLAISIHLVVRFREYQLTLPEADNATLVKKTVQSKFVPSLYAILTTIAGFTSLMICDIKPVIHFGYMMSLGILLSLGLTFVLFPACAMLLPKPKMPSKGKFFTFSLTAFLGRLTESYGKAILILTLIFTVVTVIGVSRLRVENSFIDYFKESTEIYQGMKVIDQQLGGTTPLDVIVQFETFAEDSSDEYVDDFEIDDDFFGDEEESKRDPAGRYWFMDDRLEVAEKVHDYLDSREEIGKVLSLGTLLKIGRHLNHGKSLDSIDMGILYQKLPPKYEGLILTPYVSFEKNELRFSTRIKDSMKSLQRNKLLKEIKYDLVHKLGLEEDKVHLSGAMILYNNMLQSLFASQVETLGVVAFALLIMFMVLFRSLKIALIGLFPNLLSAGAVLGFMGWLNIPLDMMTITIAAISIGIAVDDTIHYIHRFREEIAIDGDYYASLHRSHNSIGYAMYYTSLIIIVGFSILMFSNFWPTIYFGLFTGLAMFIAFVTSLTLLPQLLVWLKPFGVGR